MAVKVNHRDGAVGTVDGAEKGEGDGVVTTKSDETRERPALHGGASLVAIRGRAARQEVEVSLLDLMKGPGVVIAWGCQHAFTSLRGRVCLRCDGDVTTVEDSGPAVEGVRGEGHVVSAAENMSVSRCDLSVTKVTY